MKKILLFLFISIIVFNSNAQEVKQKRTFREWASNTPDSSSVKKTTDTIKINKTLTSGDYLIRASNNVWAGVACAAVSGLFIYQAGRADTSSNKRTLNTLGGVSGVAAIAFFPISFSININTAGKKYNGSH